MPPITLLTDFGTRDTYVGVVKGVIAGRCPGATVIDLTHEVAPGDVAAAAYLLADAWRYFPAGTVHLAVVDPGVGGPRKALAAAAGGQFFIGPDNGLFTHVFHEARPSQLASIENSELFVQPVSRTFHGRDIFAPAAAALLCGTPLHALGPPLERWEVLMLPEPWRGGDGTLIGQVIHIDRFGNLITNFHREDLPANPLVRIAGQDLRGLCGNYDAAPAGQLLALIGSSGRLEISANRGSAAQKLGAAVGTQLAVTTAGGPS